MHDPKFGNSIVEALTQKNLEIKEDRLEILFQDFVASAVLGEKYYGASVPALSTGITERAVALGLYTSALDMDDVNWRVLTHPGSIIWPIATSIGIERGLTLKQVYEAAAYGYRTGATIANFFGPLHRSKWHITATSGAFAAATTAAKMRMRVLANGLSFANGVALSRDGRHLFVNETGRSRIWKLDVNARDLNVGSGSAQAVLLFDNLPGYPDNLTRGRDGRIWAGFAKPRNATLDALADKPFLRKLTLRLPRAWWPIPKPYGHVFAFTEDGRIVADLQDPDGAYPESTGVTETAERLYIQSLHAGYLGWMPNPLGSGRD